MHLDVSTLRVAECVVKLLEGYHLNDKLHVAPIIVQRLLNFSHKGPSLFIVHLTFLETAFNWNQLAEVLYLLVRSRNYLLVFITSSNLSLENRQVSDFIASSIFSCIEDFSWRLGSYRVFHNLVSLESGKLRQNLTHRITKLEIWNRLHVYHHSYCSTCY